MVQERQKALDDRHQLRQKEISQAANAAGKAGMNELTRSKPILTIDCRCDLERNNRMVTFPNPEPRKKIMIYKAKSSQGVISTMVQIRLRQSGTLIFEF